MISLADSERIIAAAERWAYCLVGACVALFAGSALLGQQAQFQGSVPTGMASPTPVALTLQDAIDRGLKTNLGLLLSGQASESARGERLKSLSALLHPRLHRRVYSAGHRGEHNVPAFLHRSQERSQGWQRGGCGLAKLFEEAIK